MIIVIGEVSIRPDRIDEALSISVEHVNRSRTEPGCVAHDVAIDAQDPSRLVFVEYWSGMPALQQHFAVAASKAFFAAISEMAASEPELRMFSAEALNAK